MKIPTPFVGGVGILTACRVDTYNMIVADAKLSSLPGSIVNPSF
jgi:hypothetical protein